MIDQGFQCNVPLRRPDISGCQWNLREGAAVGRLSGVWWGWVSLVLLAPFSVPEAPEITLPGTLGSGNHFFCQLPEFRLCLLGYGVALFCSCFCESVHNIKETSTAYLCVLEGGHQAVICSAPPCSY